MWIGDWIEYLRGKIILSPKRSTSEVAQDRSSGHAAGLVWYGEFYPKITSWKITFHLEILNRNLRINFWFRIFFSYFFPSEQCLTRGAASSL